MNSKLVMADCLDIFSGIFLSYLNVGDVLEWIYMGVLIASLVLSIFLKVKSALEDKKITAEEMKEIVDEAKKATDIIKDEKERIESQNKTKEGQEDKQ